MSARSRKTICLQNGSPPGGRRWLWLVVGASGMLAAQAANANPQVVLPNGLPVQVKPTYSEPGLPAFSFPPSGGSLLGGSSADTGNGAGSGSTSTGGGSTGGSGDAYNTMMSQSWGSAAANAAGAMGVSATALAATCVMESNCQNVGVSGSTSTAAGAFQMINTTYTADIDGALAYNPTISSNIVSGLSGEMDPATEAYAAAYELRTDALALQNDNVTNLTVLQARAMYQFGSGAGLGVAEADDSENLESYINLTPAQLVANGLTASETVGQWRQTIINKIGASTANRSILSQ
jgi:hypothetical protein